MIVGKVLNQKNYPRQDYIDAVMITAGIATFMLSSKVPPAIDDQNTQNTSTEILGCLILCSYVTCDSFTSQWQSFVFKKFKIDQFQMMFGLNAFSIFITSIKLYHSGEGLKALKYLHQNSLAMSHVLVLSLTSATGQLFIFYTIKKFGPIVFTIIMMTRQMFSMIISCFFYGHELSKVAFTGAAIVFSTLAYKTHSKLQSKNRK